MSVLFLILSFIKSFNNFVKIFTKQNLIITRLVNIVQNSLSDVALKGVFLIEKKLSNLNNLLLITIAKVF